MYVLNKWKLSDLVRNQNFLENFSFYWGSGYFVRFQNEPSRLVSGLVLELKFGFGLGLGSGLNVRSDLRSDWGFVMICWMMLNNKLRLNHLHLFSTRNFSIIFRNKSEWRKMYRRLWSGLWVSAGVRRATLRKFRLQWKFLPKWWHVQTFEYFRENLYSTKSGLV